VVAYAAAVSPPNLLYPSASLATRVSEAKPEETKPTRSSFSVPDSPAAVAGTRRSIAAAERVGRFHILGLVGAGGMGQVYAAYDPKLDRRVALKVLLDGRDRVDDARLVREAQALARLAHPNVVVVHDVGTHDGHLFVAMEFVEGVTLRDWLRQHSAASPERLGAVLDILIQAGSGLWAAHQANLIHRDFKPANVLVGEDGRVRVVDFGLARFESTTRDSRLDASDDAPSERDSRAQEGSTADPSTSPLLATITRTGRAIGTPAYMAPEQFRAEGVDASSDQFGFCVTAWEAVFGARPFAFNTVAAALETIRGGRVVRPAERACPETLETALRKGLAYSSARRHADMDVLLRAMRAVQLELGGGAPIRPRRRAWLAPLLFAGVASAIAFGVGRGRAQVCTGAQERLSSAWNDGIAKELQTAFLRTGASFAPDAWARFKHQVDDHAEQWIAGHRDACEAAQLRKEQSVELMDLRMACLDARRQELAALIEVYASADVDMIARSDDAVAQLGRVDACSDTDHVRHRGALPRGEQLERAEAILASVARSSALQAAGRYEEALARATEAHAGADALALTPVAARAHLQLGKVYMVLRQGEAARAELERAYLLAKRGDVPEVAFDASRALVQVTGVLLMRFSEGRWWAKAARFEAEAVDDALALARLHVDLGSFARVEGRFVEASERYEEAVASLRRSVGPEHLAYASALGSLGDLRMVQGGPEGALPLIEEAMGVAERALGVKHPTMARFHTSLARAHRLRGELDVAFQQVERGLRLSEDAFGSKHVALGAVLEELANVLEDRGEPEQAIAALERAGNLSEPEPLNDAKRAQLLAREGEIRTQQHDYSRAEMAYRRAAELSRSAVGDFHPQTARIRIGLGTALGALGKRQEGLALIEAGLTVGEAVLGGEHPNVAMTHDTLAAEMEREGDFEKALEHIEHSLRINERAFGSDGFPLLRPHGNMCAVLGQLGRVEEAVVHCNAALALAERAVSFDEGLVAGLHNNLGAALVAARRYDEALKHYHRARETWERQLGPRHVVMGIVLANIAEVAEALGRLDDAQEAYRESLAIREERVGRSDPMVVVPLVGLANIATKRGEPEAAVAFARRALGVATESSAPALVSARAEEALAHALWVSGRRTEAAELATRAGQAFERAGATAAADRARLATWFSGEPVVEH
jgi:eukaryotic-like serine/threonine-protein kinase